MKSLISGPILQKPISPPVSDGNGRNEVVSKDQIDACFNTHTPRMMRELILKMNCDNQKKSCLLLECCIITELKLYPRV